MVVSSEAGEASRVARGFLMQFPESRALLADAATPEPAQERHQVWSWLLATFFRYPQAVLLVLVVGLIAPPLVAQDVRSRAFLLYFSRPLSRLEYIAGKAATVSGYVLMITTLPALFLYVLGLLLSPGLNVVLHTWDLPLRILASSVVLLLPTVSLALAFSSLTSESRYAGFAWFAVWVLGWVAYMLLVNSMPMPSAVAEDGTFRADVIEAARRCVRPLVGLFAVSHAGQGAELGLRVPHRSGHAAPRDRAPGRPDGRLVDGVVPPRVVAHADMMAMIQLDHVTKLYGPVIGVNDVTLTLQQRAYGLLGPNGSGKSTLLNLITGQLRPTLGGVQVLGQDPRNNAAVFRRLGVCPEQDVLYGNVTAFQWVRYLLELHGFGRGDAAARAEAALTQVGMAHAMHRQIGGYSQGMRQRTKLAQALAHEPELLILDEPFNGLDPIGRHDMTVVLRNWVQAAAGCSWPATSCTRSRPSRIRSS